MPLAFDSLTHGTVAFGFFNIETDMLLLERFFFFATDFCEALERVAERAVGDPRATSIPAYRLADAAAVGDLMGAIHGVRYSGFLGAVYRRFPFPSDPAGFRQQPEGAQNRSVLEELIADHGELIELALRVEESPPRVCLGEVEFDPAGFRELVRYVWRGGYPRWRDDIRPDYVLRMWKKFE